MSTIDFGVRTGGPATAGPTDDRPLSDQEYKLLQRLLSDPFSLPLPFKTWLVSYLESSDLSLPMSSVQGLSTAFAALGASTTTTSTPEA